jgi:NAD(P)-dependent dehydrogenase (short-subunit alcohol dehydrogenase family)
MTKCVLITGASCGIGLATADYFHRKGWNVAASMRDPAKDHILGERPGLIRPQLDVTDPNSIQAAVDEVLQHWGRIDVLINNAGYGLIGPFEAADEMQIRRQFEVNVFGLMAVTRAVLPSMRAAGSGTVVNISSMSGYTTFPYYSLYHAGKWAVEGFSESLRYELESFGIRVKLVEPGVVKTDFHTRSKENAALAVYEPHCERSLERMDRFYRFGNSAERVAETVYRAATGTGAKLRYPLGWDARAAYLIKRIAPDCLIRRLIRFLCIH